MKTVAASRPASKNALVQKVTPKQQLVLQRDQSHQTLRSVSQVHYASESAHGSEAELSSDAGMASDWLLPAVALLQFLTLLDQRGRLPWEYHVVMVMTTTMVTIAMGDFD